MDGPAMGFFLVVFWLASGAEAVGDKKPIWASLCFFCSAYTGWLLIYHREFFK
jgi:hypothetical protein